MRTLVIFLLILSFAATVYAADMNTDVKNQIPNTIGSLTNCVSTQPGDLKAEAEGLGIPPGQTRRYVSEMRDLNQNYQAGALTRTEYVAAKREVIRRLK